LGFGDRSKSNHGKDRHGLMVGFSPKFCFGIVVVCGFAVGADWVCLYWQVAWGLWCGGCFGWMGFIFGGVSGWLLSFHGLVVVVFVGWWW